MRIKLSQYEKSFVTRDTAKKIAASIVLNDESVELDFSDIDTITPSFSHEFISNILENNSSVKRVEFLNTNKSVELQLKKALLSIKKEKESDEK